MERRLLFVGLVALGGLACGGGPKLLPPNVKMRQIDPPVAPPATVSVVKDSEIVDPFQATSGTGDSAVPYVRDERSSRLDVPAPKTRGKEKWRLPLAIGDEAPLKPSFVLTTGNRAAVISADAWVVFDTKGVRIAGHEMESPYMRLDRASGKIIVDDTRAADLPADAKLATKNGLAVMVKGGAVNVGERAIEGTFEALEVAIDESSNAVVVVKQKDDVSLWTVPISGNAGGGIGRHKIGKKARVIGPPILGKSVRTVVLDTGVVAYDLTGKKLWERRGVPSGGVTVTSDDRVLIADNAKILAYDRRGKALELWSGSDIVFATPAILTADGLLLVASARYLHAISF